MSFGDGDLHARVDRLEAENTQLRIVVGFMLDRLDAYKFRKIAPASYGYIVKELGKAGIEIGD